MLPSAVFTKEELQHLADHIVDSGELGRSKVYVNLLNYLLKHGSSGTKPKEIEIAIEVLGRTSDFDVSKDSVVRVYIHQLRKKLDSYYQKYQQDARYRIIIPKGQYTIAVVPSDNTPSPTPEDEADLETAPERSSRLTAWMLIVVASLLGINLLYLMNPDRNPTATDVSRLPASHLQPWSSLLDDDLPILLVMGDYYIFGEVNELGDVSRMIRDFSINSPADLNRLFMQDSSMRNRYLDLQLNYMPEGSALALARIVPVLQQAGKRVNVTMMSKLSTADLKSNHIVYIGYISGLDKLHSLVFNDSGLQIGRTYDELINVGTGEIYSSDAGLPSGNEPFRDYGLFTTFPATSQNQFVIIAGTRDAGLMHTAQAAVNPANLNAIAQSLYGKRATDSFEALYEVFGFDRLNFDANLVYSRELHSSRIWGGELSNSSMP